MVPLLFYRVKQMRHKSQKNTAALFSSHGVVLDPGVFLGNRYRLGLARNYCCASGSRPPHYRMFGRAAPVAGVLALN
jgi:hypothetical protein